MEPLLSVEELVRELDEPNLLGWKLFSESPSLTIYRRPNKKLIDYKCFTHFPDISPDVSYKVTIDLEYRLIWDKYLKEGRQITDGEKQGVYWQVAMPLHMDNRDYTFVQEYNEYDIDDRHFYYVSTRSEQFTNEATREQVVRIDTCQSQTLFCSDGANGFKSVFFYFEDPRGTFPKATWNWVAKFGIPIYAKSIHNAYKVYPEWINNKQSVLSNLVDDDIDSAAATAAAAAIIMPTNTTIDNDGNNDEEDDD